MQASFCLAAPLNCSAKDPIPYSEKALSQISPGCEMPGKTAKSAVIGMRFMDIWMPFSI